MRAPVRGHACPHTYHKGKFPPYAIGVLSRTCPWNRTPPRQKITAPRRAQARPSWTSPTTNDQNPTADRADTRTLPHAQTPGQLPDNTTLKGIEVAKAAQNTCATCIGKADPNKKRNTATTSLNRASGPNLQIDPSHPTPPPGARNWSSSQAWNLSRPTSPPFSSRWAPHHSAWWGPMLWFTAGSGRAASSTIFIFILAGWSNLFHRRWPLAHTTPTLLLKLLAAGISPAGRWLEPTCKDKREKYAPAFKRTKFFAGLQKHRFDTTSICASEKLFFIPFVSTGLW